MSNNKTNKNLQDYKFADDSFELVQLDKNIHDVKFETKPTTFAKDALKRFLKNKSSVVGAFIIGFLLLCSFLLPVVIPYDISAPHADQALLPPRLFEAGTGFWDGTKTYTNILYNAETESPSGFNGEYVVKVISMTEGEKTNTYNPNAMGGSLVMKSRNPLTAGQDKYSNAYIMTNYEPFTVTATDNYVLKYTLNSDTDYNGCTLGEYRIVLKTTTSTYVLKDWSKDYGEVELNLSDYIKNDLNKDELKVNIQFELAPEVGSLSYIMIDKLDLTADVEDEATLELLSEISITDANKTIGYQKLPNGKFPVGYWRSNADKELYQASITYLDFVYDEYGAKLGTIDMMIGGSDMQSYVDKGWCEYDFKVGAESFKILDEKCPVKEVYSQSYDSSLNIYTLNTKTTYYRYLGYNSMPRYLFGTTDDGKDIIKAAFSGLRTSLLIALVSSAICFAFGLCWGSISGYFGGNVDLFMERFCEILGGVPWIVVMTLVLLLFGNNIFTFALALCLTGWLGVAARTRTQFYRFKGREYVLASRTLGASDIRLIFKHILPNGLGTIITSSILMIPSVIFSEATLSYLNLGLQGVDSFGLILSKNQKYLSTFPALVVFPAVIVSLLMISFNLFGNGLRDALNPSLKGSE